MFRGCTCVCWVGVAPCDRTMTASRKQRGSRRRLCIAALQACMAAGTWEEVVEGAVKDGWDRCPWQRQERTREARGPKNGGKGDREEGAAVLSVTSRSSLGEQTHHLIVGYDPQHQWRNAAFWLLVELHAFLSTATELSSVGRVVAPLIPGRDGVLRVHSRWLIAV